MIKHEFLWFYFNSFLLLREIILILDKIISCCNKWSKFIICLKYKFIMMVMIGQNILYSANIATNLLTVIFMMSNRNFSHRKKSYLFLSKLSRFIMLVFHGWYQRRSNIVFSGWTVWRIVYRRAMVYWDNFLEYSWTFIWVILCNSTPR